MVDLFGWTPYIIVIVVVILLIVFRKRVTSTFWKLVRKIQDPRKRILKDLESRQRRALEYTLLLQYSVEDQAVLDHIGTVIGCVTNSRVYSPECKTTRVHLDTLLGKLNRKEVQKQFLILLLVYKEVTILSECYYHTKYLESSFDMEYLYNEVDACEKMIGEIEKGTHHTTSVLDLIQLPIARRE